MMLHIQLSFNKLLVANTFHLNKTLFGKKKTLCRAATLGCNAD